MQQPNKWGILSGVILAMLLSSLDQTIVSTAMPTIVQELHGLEHMSWVFTAYMLGSTVTVPIYGRLSDIFGRRKLYLIAIFIFLGGSVLCGLAQNMTQLILFRALQGIGGGAMMVNSFAVIGDVFPPAERSGYQGMIGGVFGLSSVAGPLLGGWITDHTSWRWVFYVNIPLGAIAIGVLSAALPKIAPRLVNRRIDWTGAFFIVLTLVPLLLSLVWGGSIYGWTSWQIGTALGVAAVALVFFIRTERRAVNPILSFDLFRRKVFIVAVVAMFITAMGMFGAILYVPIFSQGVIGGSATHAGLILTPLMLALVTASALSGQLISKTGKYKVLAIGGTALITISLFYFSTITAHTSNQELIFRMVLLGIGLGSTMPIFTLAVQSAFARERLGEVTAGTQLFRSIGGTVGTAVLGGIMNTRLTNHVEEIKAEPFVARLQGLQGTVARPFDATGIQSILNRDYQQGVREALQGLPVPARAEATAQLNHLVAASKTAFSDAVDGVFIVAGCLMTVALIAVFFLPEIPLRKTEKPELEKAGHVLEDELGNDEGEERRAAAGARK